MALRLLKGCRNSWAQIRAAAEACGIVMISTAVCRGDVEASGAIDRCVREEASPKCAADIGDPLMEIPMHVHRTPMTRALSEATGWSNGSRLLIDTRIIHAGRIPDALSSTVEVH